MWFTLGMTEVWAFLCLIYNINCTRILVVSKDFFGYCGSYLKQKKPNNNFIEYVPNFFIKLKFSIVGWNV